MQDMRDVLAAASPVELIELGFGLLCWEREAIHDQWRLLHAQLEALRENGVPHDAGEHDARIDCLLRGFEDEQRDIIKATGEPSPHSRTKLQIQLTRYWISSTYEFLRTTENAMPPENEHRSLIRQYKVRFGAYRMPIAKQSPQRIEKPGLIHAFDTSRMNMSDELKFVAAPYAGRGTYRVRPIMGSETGSVAFVVYDGLTKVLQGQPRQELSDELLALSDLLPKL